MDKTDCVLWTENVSTSNLNTMKSINAEIVYPMYGDINHEIATTMDEIAYIMNNFLPQNI